MRKNHAIVTDNDCRGENASRCKRLSYRSAFIALNLHVVISAMEANLHGGMVWRHAYDGGAGPKNAAEIA